MTHVPTYDHSCENKIDTRTYDCKYKDEKATTEEERSKAIGSPADEASDDKITIWDIP